MTRYPSIIFLSTFLYIHVNQAQLKPQYSRASTHFNRTVDLSFIVKKNQTGHYITSWSVKNHSPKLPDNMKIDVRSSMSEFGGLQTVHIHGMMTVPPPKPTGYEYFPGIGYYKFYPNSVQTFYQAMDICANDGAHLAILNSVAESEVLKLIYARYPKEKEWAYMGFHDIDEEGKFVTIFGDPLSNTGFTTWNPGQPDQAGGNEDCGSIHRTGRLNDLSCEKYGPWPFFCEFDLSWSVF